MLTNPDFKQHFNIKLQTRNGADMYVNILSIFHKFIDYIISESNNHHSMLTVHKGNPIVTK